MESHIWRIFGKLVLLLINGLVLVVPYFLIMLLLVAFMGNMYVKRMYVAR